MSESFDPYLKWLGIKPKDQPPNHYRLLGIDLFEDDPDIIENAANKQMVHLRTFQTGQNAKLSQQLLNEVSAARICLLNQQSKTAYDGELKSSVQAPQRPAPAPKPAAKPAAQAARETFAFKPTTPARSATAPQKKGTPAWQLAALGAVGVGVLLVVVIIAFIATRSDPTADVPEFGGEGAAVTVDQDDERHDSDTPPHLATKTDSQPKQKQPDDTEQVAAVPPPPVIPVPPTGGIATKEVYLDELHETSSAVFPTSKLGKLGATGYPEGQPQRCRFRGRELRHALSVHPPSKGASFVEYHLAGKYQQLVATAGLLDKGQGTRSSSPLHFKVIGDGTLLWQSRAMQSHGDGQECEVDIAGVNELRLEVECPLIAGSSFAVWISPRVSLVAIDEPKERPAATSAVYLDDVQEADFKVGFGALGKRGRFKPDSDRPVGFRGTAAVHSLVTHPPSDGSATVTYLLDKQFGALQAMAAMIGRQGTGKADSPLTFKVFGDGKLLWKSPVLQDYGDGEPFTVKLGHVRELKLQVDCPGPSNGPWAVWLDPRLLPDPPRTSDPGPAAPPPRSAAEKLPVPDAAKQKEIEALIKEIYAGEDVDAQRLLTDGKNLAEKPDAHYVTFRIAAEFAQRSGDAETAVVAIDAMAEFYDVDPWEMKVTALTEISKTARGADFKDKVKKVAEVAFASAEDAVVENNFDAAEQLAEIALAAARKAKDTSLVKEIVQRSKEFRQLATAYASAKEAFSVLESQPDDPKANLTAGRYLCFAKGDWPAGLPMLAKGSDPALATLAKSDLQQPGDADAQLKLGNAWWDLAADAEGESRKHLQLRAGYWYGEARLSLKGLPREHAEKRLKEIARKYPSFVPSVNYQNYSFLKKFRHGGYNLAVAFFPDGKHLATNGKVWDIASGKLVREVAGQRRLAISPDGTRLALSINSNTVIIYDVESGAQKATLQGKAIGSLAYAPDGSMLVSAGHQNVVVLSDAETGKEIGELAGHKFIVRSAVFSPDGRWIASCSYDKTVKLWDVATRQVIATFTGHAANVDSVAFSPDGRLIASGSTDKLIKIWDIASRREKGTLAGHTAAVRCVAFSPDSRTLASGTDKSVKLWNVTSSREIATLDEHPGRVYVVAFSPGGKMLAASGDSIATLWKFETD